MHQKKYLIELLPAVAYYTRHALTCAEIAEYIAKYNGKPNAENERRVGLDIEVMFKFEFHDAGFTGKWLGNTIYEFGINRRDSFVAFGRIFEINF